MTAPRQVLPGTTYLVSRRCAQRQFLLKPSRTTNEVFGFVLAVAEGAPTESSAPLAGEAGAAFAVRAGAVAFAAAFGIVVGSAVEAVGYAVRQEFSP